MKDSLQYLETARSQSRTWEMSRHDMADPCSMPTLMLRTADAGGGPYLVLNIEEWAINPEELEGFAAFLVSQGRAMLDWATVGSAS